MSALHRSRKGMRVGGIVVAATLLLSLALGAAQPPTARADGGIVFDGSPGTDPPPSTLGPYTMIPFPFDDRPIVEWPRAPVWSVPGPTGDVAFSELMYHWQVGDTGVPWNEGYAGGVYEATSDEVTMTLPPGTYAFYFYATPGVADCASFGATAQDGTGSGVVSVCLEPGLPEPLGPYGAKYFGFYSTGSPLESIRVTCDRQFALGQFGINGEPAAPQCTRADVAVVIYGGWDGIPVRAYVGGTEQETLYTAHDAFGQPAVLWTFYPPQSAAWSVRVEPQLPAGLDPARWQLKPVAIRTNKTSYGAGGTDTTIGPCSEHVFYFQLVDTGAPGE